MSKRQKFVFASVFLGVQLVLCRFFLFGWQHYSALLMAFFSAVVILLSLWGDLTFLSGVIVSILPASFAAGVTLFSFLLPGQWLVICLYMFLFIFSMYAIFLTENVFGVAAIRTIQLVRAAHAVGFLFTILTFLLLSNVVLAFHLSAWTNAIFIGAISLPLVFHAFWVIKLDPHLLRQTLIRTGGVVLVMMQVGFSLSFLPAPSTIVALFLTAVLYGVMGLVEQDLLRSLTLRTILEYLGVIVVVFFLLLWQSSWRG
jgi:hypothetical protein